MYRDPGFEQCAHHTLLSGASVNRERLALRTLAAHGRRTSGSRRRKPGSAETGCSALGGGEHVGLPILVAGQ